MKKTIAFLICLLAIMSLTGCGNANTDELAELRERVEILEAKVSEYENSETAEEQPKEETFETTKTNTDTNAVTDQAMLAYLDKQVQSNSYDDWTEVAECEVATETHLLTIAKKCSTGNPNLAQKIADNNATTGAVMTELANSADYDVWTVVALSDKSDEQSLLTIAKKCSTGNSNLAQKIANNNATTGAVMAELANSTDYDVWTVVALSDKSDEQSLLTIAQKCSNGNSNLAQKIANNPNITIAILQTLSNSRDARVVSIGNKAIETMSP